MDVFSFEKLYMRPGICQVPRKLNIKVRVNKGQLADHDLWHSDQATVDLTLRVAGLDYKN